MARRPAQASPPAGIPPFAGDRPGETTGALVVRFRRQAAGEGIARMRGAGLQVAASSDFRAGKAPPVDFGGAQVLYFERFGLAILERSEKVQGALVQATESRAIANTRPERLFRALGPAYTRDYLIGYRDGVCDLVDRLLGDGAVAARDAAAVEESEATWGLQATRVAGSPLSGAGIKVAVLDTGFDVDHPDFVGRSVVSRSFVADEDVRDLNGHGTHCIGTACGPRSPSDQPRYGIAHEASIHAGKVLSNAGTGSDRTIIGGIDWALDQGCHVISMSLGAIVGHGQGFVEDYDRIGEVALDEGALIIAAAGNNSRRPGLVSPVNSPANAPSIMAVAAVDAGLDVAWFSCGGVNPHQEVDIAAPGVDVLSSHPGGYERLDGTSMATPHVAGIAALWAEKDAKYRGRSLWACLLQNARSLDAPARDVGRGLVQAPY